jgi:hypothetical protein
LNLEPCVCYTSILPLDPHLQLKFKTVLKLLKITINLLYVNIKYFYDKPLFFPKQNSGYIIRFHCDISIHEYNILWSYLLCLLLFWSPLSHLLKNNFNGFHYCIFIMHIMYFSYIYPTITFSFCLSPSCRLSHQTVLLLHSCDCFFRSRFCISEKACGICLSESGLFHLTWWSSVPSIFLQTI